MKTKPLWMIHLLLVTILAIDVSAQTTDAVPGPNVGDFVDIPTLTAGGPFAVFPSGGKALVIDQGRLKTVDLATKAVQLTPVTGLNASRLVIESSGSSALIANQNELDRVDLSTWTRTTIATGFTSIRGIAIESSGQTVLVSDNGAISRVALSNGQTTSLAFGSGGDLAIEPAGTSIITPNGVGPVGFGNGLVRIDLQTGTSTLIVGITVRGQAIEIAPDGSFALMVASTQGADTGIAKVDLSTGAVTQLIQVSFGIGSASIADLAISPDASQVLSTWNTPNGSIFRGSRSRITAQTPS